MASVMLMLVMAIPMMAVTIVLTPMPVIMVVAGFVVAVVNLRTIIMVVHWGRLVVHDRRRRVIHGWRRGIISREAETETEIHRITRIRGRSD